MNLNRKARSLAAGALVAVGLAMLTACSNSSDDLAAKVGGQLPDLTSQGLESFPCGDGDAIGGSFQAPKEPYVAECWTGSPSGTFLDVANSAADAVALATGGSNVTSEACPDDAFSAAGGIACRAALVTEGDASVLVRTVVVLAEPKQVLANLPEEPTQEQIREALKGASIEVMIGTESPTAAESSSAPSTN